jgi:pyruvate/2-oxoglutarate dehydrogenase complex dihydrolipoamide dehydrogenase (E3) component
MPASHWRAKLLDLGIHEGARRGDADRILGFAMLGAQAGEVMAAVQMAMLGGLPFTALRDGIIAHPTLLNTLFGKLVAVPSQ